MAKRQRTLGEIMGVAGPVSEDTYAAKEGKRVAGIDLTEMAASHKIRPQVVKKMSKVPEEMYPKYSFRNVDFRKLVEKHELTCAKSLLCASDLVLRDPLYNVRSDRQNVRFPDDVLTVEFMADDAVALCKRVPRPGAHGHPFCTALRYGQK